MVFSYFKEIDTYHLLVLSNTDNENFATKFHGLFVVIPSVQWKFGMS